LGIILIPQPALWRELILSKDFLENYDRKRHQYDKLLFDIDDWKNKNNSRHAKR